MSHRVARACIGMRSAFAASTRAAQNWPAALHGPPNTLEPPRGALHQVELKPVLWRNSCYMLRISSERLRGGDRLRLCTIGPLLACAPPTAADSDSATGSRAAPL